MANETYEHRIENERKHLTEQRKALQEKYDQEIKARKELEDKLKAFEAKHWRQRSQNRGRGRGQGTLHTNSRDFGSTRPTNNSNNNNSTQAAAFQMETARQNIPRRPSLLPRPSRPSTPIRPPYTREPESNSSTLTSSISSTFSRTSQNTNESFSSADTFSMRCASPNSPRTVIPTSPEELMAPPPQPRFGRENTALETERESASHVKKPSWANVARSGSSTK
jgi:hypothetical protein